MKMTKILKVASVAVLASTLAACGKEKVTKKDYEKWAKDNGYVLESGIDYEGWAEDNDYVLESGIDYEGWAEENGYTQNVVNTKPELEISFGHEMSSIDAAYLKNYIGSKDAVLGETFGEKKDLIVFYGINECNSCAAAKPIINAWVEATGYKVYYYNPDNSAASSAEKEAMLRKLGSTDGVTLTGPQLVFFVDGERVYNLTADSMTEERINTAVDYYYNTTAGAVTVNTKKELETLADLRKSIANEEQFILYATRYNCPWCRKLADTKRDNGINKAFREYTGNFYTITAEKVLGEYNNIYVKGGLEDLAIVEKGTEGAMTAWAWLYNQDNGAVVDAADGKPAYWPSTTTSVQKAEVLLYLVATGEVSPNVTNNEITNADQVAFLKEVAAYAAKTDSKKFLATDRNIPAFIAVGWTEAEEEANTTAVSVIISRRTSVVKVDFENDEITIDETNANRVLFPEYFTGATSGSSYKLDSVTPQSEIDLAYNSLMKWMNSWTYKTTTNK